MEGALSWMLPESPADEVFHADGTPARAEAHQRLWNGNLQGGQL